jgi:hypothetical protein
VILPSPVTRCWVFEHASETHLDDGDEKLKLKQLSPSEKWRHLLSG